jgi:hypothetical protein
MIGRWGLDVKVLRAFYGRDGGEIPPVEVLADIWEDLCLEAGLAPVGSAVEREGVSEGAARCTLPGAACGARPLAEAKSGSGSATAGSMDRTYEPRAASIRF